MTKRRRPHIPLQPLYILTAADGFTSMCAATQSALAAELARLPFLAPIRVSSWTPVGDGLRIAEWRLLDEWEHSVGS